MKPIVISKRQVFLNTAERIFDLKNELHLLDKEKTEINKPVDILELKESMKRSKRKSDIKTLIETKENSVIINYEMHKFYANLLDENVMVDPTM